jgi:hypothetical protein
MDKEKSPTAIVNTVKESEVEKEKSPKPAKLLTMAYLNAELEALKKTVLEQGQQIAGLQEALARKRRPVISNSKVQIRDKKTGHCLTSSGALPK